jgi:hypothetical protein
MCLTLFGRLPTQIYEGDILLLEWKAESALTRVEDGIDT